MKNTRILFMGTPEFAGFSLKTLIKNEYNVVSVVTKVDAKKDRGQKIKFSPVKEIAIENSIPVFQPENLKAENFSDYLTEINPDLIIVVAYGKILPEYVIDYPKYGCINIHASLLPKYRGSAPIQYAVKCGEKVSGITTMLIGKGLVDTGDILLKKEILITKEDTGGSLHDKLMEISGDILIETIENIETITPEKQDDSLATYAPMIKKDDTIIDFNEDAIDIINKIRGFYPFPTTSFEMNDKFYKIHKAELYSSDYTGESGKIIEFSKDKLLIGAKNGIINILEIQPPNKKCMSIKDFYNGALPRRLK